MHPTQGVLGRRDLRLVGAIGEAGSLTGAARRLGIDHSSAFRRLGVLESRVGVRLFERARDGYTPTPAGEIAVGAARRILGELGELERRLAGEDMRPAGTVRVTTTDTLLELLAPLFAGLRLAHPRITVEVVAANAFFTLTRRDADVAVRPAACAPENLVGRRVATVATAVYASRDHRRTHGGDGDPRAHDWIGLDESLAHLGAARWMRAEIPAERIVHRADSLLALRAAARAGMGLAPLPCFLADGDAALVRVHPPIPEAETGLWLLTHPDLRRVARIRTFLDFIGGGLRERRPTIEGEGPAEEACGPAPLD